MSDLKRELDDAMERQKKLIAELAHTNGAISLLIHLVEKEASNAQS